MRGNPRQHRSGSLNPRAHIASPTTRGRAAEDFAASYLEGKGYRVLARNQRTPVAELDLVCIWGDCLVVVEVKARRSARFGSGWEAMEGDKTRRLRAGAHCWLSAKGYPAGHVRFDLIEIGLDEWGTPVTLRHQRDLYLDRE